MKKTAVYPGTFDPITKGHSDIIKRAVHLVDHLIIGVALDANKTPIFSVQERVEMIQQSLPEMHIPELKEVTVVGFEGLLVDFAKKHQATLLIRGLRAVSDFEYEFQMAGMNSKLDPSIQTVFLPASEQSHFIASRFVKEICRLGGNVEGLVSEHVRQKLENYYK